MIVARNALALGDLLIFHGRLQHHAMRKVVDQLTLDLLPGRWMSWIFVATMPLQIGTAPIVLFLRNQNIGGALVEIDAHAITGFQDRQPTAGRGFRRGIEDRWRARGTRLPP